jgi:hypothetical protein
MDYPRFKRLINSSGFKNAELCRLLQLNPKSFNNYTQQGVPLQMAVILTLINELENKGITKIEVIDIISQVTDEYASKTTERVKRFDTSC